MSWCHRSRCNGERKSLPGPLLLIWIIFNPSIGRQLHPSWTVGNMTYLIIKFNGAPSHWHIEAGWRLHASMIWVTIRPCNRFSPVWCQAVTLTNYDLFSNGHRGTYLRDYFFKYKYTNAFEKIVYKMTTILSMPQWVNRIIIYQWPVLLTWISFNLSMD